MKINKKIILIIILISGMLLVTACGGEINDQEDQKLGEVDTENDQMIEVEHEFGTSIINKNPKKIVVFDYGLLDIISNLDYGDNIVGVPKASLPPYLEKFNKEDIMDVGSLKEPNFEKIFDLKPDLILISGRQVALFKEFEEIAPTVYLPIDGENYFYSFEKNVEIIGSILDKEEIAKKKIEYVRTKVGELKSKTDNITGKGLFLMANDGSLSAYGPESRFGMLYKDFGIEPVDENIVADNHGQKISFEYILNKDPDYIYVLDRAVVAGGDVSAKEVMENDLIKNTKAYKNDNIIYLDGYIWYVSSGGIEGTLKMIEEIDSSL